MGGQGHSSSDWTHNMKHFRVGFPSVLQQRAYVNEYQISNVTHKKHHSTSSSLLPQRCEANYFYIPISPYKADATERTRLQVTSATGNW